MLCSYSLRHSLCCSSHLFALPILVSLAFPPRRRGSLQGTMIAEEREDNEEEQARQARRRAEIAKQTEQLVRQREQHILEMSSLASRSRTPTGGLSTEVLVQLAEHAQFGLNERFVPLFNLGTAAYISGNWSVARDYLHQALAIYPADKGGQVLLDVMGETDYRAPKNWPVTNTTLSINKEK